MITVQRGSSAALVSVFGRFDAHEVPGVRAALQQVISSAPAASHVRVDLAMTDFFDSRALMSLLDAHAAGRARGVRVQIAGASCPVRVMMKLTGVTGELLAA